MALAEAAPPLSPEPDRPPVVEHIADMRIPAHVELQDAREPLSDNVFFLDDYRPDSPSSPAYNRQHERGKGVYGMPTRASLGIDEAKAPEAEAPYEAKHMRPKVSVWWRLGAFVARARGRVDAVQNPPSSNYQDLAEGKSYAEASSSPAQYDRDEAYPPLVAVPNLPAEQGPEPVATAVGVRPVLTVVPNDEQTTPPADGPDVRKSAMFAAWKSGSRAGRTAAAAMHTPVASEATVTPTITSPRPFTRGWQDDAADAIRKNNAFDPDAPLPRRQPKT